MILLISPNFTAQNEAIRAHIGRVPHLLDIGAGIRERFAEANTPECDARTTVDIWPAYAPDIVADARALPLADKSYDVALLHDVIEHLDREGGEKAIIEARRVSKRGVLIRTPLGFQTNDQPPEGAWGRGENPYQAHKSGWRPEDLCDIAEIAWVIRARPGNGWPTGDGWWSCWVPA